MNVLQVFTWINIFVKTVNEMATEGRSYATTQRPETSATNSRDWAET